MSQLGVSSDAWSSSYSRFLRSVPSGALPMTEMPIFGSAFNLVTMVVPSWSTGDCFQRINSAHMSQSAPTLGFTDMSDLGQQSVDDIQSTICSMYLLPSDISV